MASELHKYTSQEALNAALNSDRDALKVDIDNATITAGDLEVDTDATQQVLEFVNFDTELFKIQDSDQDQTFDIIFQVIVNNSIAQEIFVRFEYKPSNNLGDVNGDGVIDLRDLVALSDHVLQGKAINKPEYANINKTDEITKHDVIELGRRILHG